MAEQHAAPSQAAGPLAAAPAPTDAAHAVPPLAPPEHSTTTRTVQWRDLPSEPSPTADATGIAGTAAAASGDVQVHVATHAHRTRGARHSNTRVGNCVKQYGVTVLLCVLGVLTMLLLVREDLLPGGNLFALLLLFVLGNVGGWLSSKGLSKLIKCIKSTCCCCCSANNRHHTRHHSPTHRRPAHGSGGDNATEDINEQASDEEHEEEEEAAPELGQGLPPLVGMLVVGIILRNLPDNMALSGLSPDWMGAIRNIALAIILVRAGLGLDVRKLLQLAGVMLTLATVPCLVEATVGALLASAFLGFTLRWGFLLGFILSDVSPAVTVPLLLELNEQGYGIAKGIPTMLLAGSGLNSVVAICAYGIVFPLVFTSGGDSIPLVLVKGVVEIVGGIAVGALFGWLYVEVQARQPRKSISIALSSLLVLCLACALVLGGKAIGMSGGGAIAAIAMGTVVANKRPSNSPSTTTLPAQAPHDHDNDDDSTGSDDGDDDDRAHMAGDEVMTWVVSKINSVLAVLWSLGGQTLLFALLGASLSVAQLDAGTVGTGAAIIGIALVARALATVLVMVATSRKKFNSKEMLFTAITWCPKATVQAALSTVALDYVTDAANRDQFATDAEFELAKKQSTQLMTVAVLSILLTAPAFAAAMARAGLTLLERTTGSEPDAPVITHRRSLVAQPELVLLSVATPAPAAWGVRRRPRRRPLATRRSSRSIDTSVLRSRSSTGGNSQLSSTTEEAALAAAAAGAGIVSDGTDGGGANDNNEVDEATRRRSHTTSELMAVSKHLQAQLEAEAEAEAQEGGEAVEVPSAGGAGAGAGAGAVADDALTAQSSDAQRAAAAAVAAVAKRRARASTGGDGVNI